MIPAALTAVDGRITEADGQSTQAYVVLVPVYDGQIRLPIATSTQTDGGGQFIFSNIPPGTYVLQAEACGLVPVVGRVVSGSGP
jgi:hypothetical protein